MFSRFFGNRRIFVVLFSVILMIMMMGMTRGERDRLTWPELVVKNSISYVNGIVSQSQYSMLDWIGTSSSSKGMDEELGRESQSYLQLKSEVARLKRENEQLKKDVGYTERNQTKYITARTVSRSPDRWNNRIVIDKGNQDGIKKDMPVVTQKGLIGRVTASTDHMADVQLLTDSHNGPGVAAQVLTHKNEAFGLIEGYDAKKKRLLMKKISSDAKLKKGQPVVTSDLSDIYAGQLLIGTVDQVATGDFGVDQMVYIKPAAGFERLDYVMVVEDPTKLQLKNHRKELDTKEENGGE